MSTIDFNCDLGERLGVHNIDTDEALLAFVSSCNIACGFHGGDPLVILLTIKEAMRQGVRMGAHPSYPDLQGFGRRSMQFSSQEMVAFVLYQVAALKGMVQAYGGELAHVKPHGALYNDAACDEKIAASIYEAVTSIDHKLRIFGLPNSAHEYVSNKMGLQFVPEGFADRRYDHGGQLVSRDIAGSVLSDPKEVIDQVLRLIRREPIITSSHTQIQLEVETICFHGDHSNSLEILSRVIMAVSAEGYNIGVA
ncbi:MAG: LamB/YcsF family protein [Flammeovirgaceae bacterium]|nr:LamB/YcsF family protein [Flammeovirgaceae bacterium]